MNEAKRLFRGRMINGCVGAGVGLLFLTVGGPSEWMLPIALAVTVLLSSYVIHIQTMWRQAPINAALVIATGVETHSKLGGIESGLHKVAEVLFGCLVGLCVSWAMARSNGRSRMLISGMTMERIFSRTGSSVAGPTTVAVSRLKTSGSFQDSSNNSRSLPLVTPRFQAPELSERI